jgi:hypothetical protein
MSVDAGAAGAGPGMGLSGDSGGPTSLGGGWSCSGTDGIFVCGILGAESMTDLFDTSPVATNGATESFIGPSGRMSGL